MTTWSILIVSLLHLANEKQADATSSTDRFELSIRP